ncbi:MAG: hypothetical protein PHY47_04110 [Lachnospiraceae bacterium]|nr:hypothetical protein [Lachnospiraceae bacterium]
MKIFNKKIDEREELELLKVEHVGFNVMFFTAVISLVIESYIMNCEFKIFAGEFVIVIVGAIVTLIGSIRKGNWDYYSKPNAKNYFLYSFVSAIIFTICFVIGKMRTYEFFRENYAQRIIPVGIIFFFSIFILCFVVLAFCGSLVKKKREKINKSLEETDED